MARTYKKDPPKYWRKEAKPARKDSGRRFRHLTRVQVRDISDHFNSECEDPDAVDDYLLAQPVHTEGWMTH